jgi:hypothetical protein
MKSNKPFIFFIKTKRFFLLIEILIAFTILSLFVASVIRNPIYFCRSQIKSLEKIECERIADLTFLDVKLAFLTKKIPIDDIAKYVNDAPIKSLPSYYSDTFKNKEIKRSYQIYSKKKEKITPNDEKYKLVHVKIALLPIDAKDPYTYKYKIILKS